MSNARPDPVGSDCRYRTCDINTGGIGKITYGEQLLRAWSCPSMTFYDGFRYRSSHPTLLTNRCDAAATSLP